MRILITGGAGFIGSALSKRLLQEGNEVWCLDNLSTGHMDNITDLIEHPRFHFMNRDITEPVDIPVEQIYNLACPASPWHYQKDPVHTAKTCFLGALHVLELANKYKAVVLQTSTSEIYGDPLVHPQTEDYKGNVNPIGIRSCYDEGKRISETLFFDHARQYGTKIRVVRIFNTYGPNMAPNDGRVVSNFIIQALCGDKITIYGDGSQTRCFCYIDDMVEALIRMMNNSKGFTGPVNLGNPVEMTMLELAEKIIRLTGSVSSLEFRELPQDDPVRRKPDISLAKHMLEWEPEVLLEEGLKNTIAYFKARIGNCEL
jgi:UDP-glucuronate decarboxylase